MSLYRISIAKVCTKVVELKRRSAHLAYECNMRERNAA
jgi:hypothetical protein